MSKRPSRGVTSGVGTPTKMTGRDGDLTIRKTREGKILYVKEHGSWHPINTGVDTVKLKKDVDSLIRSVNTIRSDNSPFLTIDTLNVRRDTIKLGTSGTGLQIKNNSADFEIIFDDNNKKIIGSSSSKVVRDVTDGNPSWQIGSSDTENFKIQTTYASSAKGFNKVSIGTNTASSLINEGQISLNVDGEDKLILNDSAHEILIDGVTASDVDANSQPVGIHIKNKASHSTNTNTRSSIRFSQLMSSTLSETFDEVASIVAGSEGTYNSTSSNADGYLSLQTALNGTLTERLKIASNGDVTINNISSGDGSGENFLVEESGVIKKRSAAQTLSDIGASSVSSLNDLSDVSYSSGDLTISSLDKIVASGSLTLDADVIISKVSDATGTTTNYAQQIDLDHTGNTTSGQTVTNYGLDIDLDVTGNNQGYGSNVNSFGINIAMNADAGTHSAFSGIDNTAIKAVLTGDTTTSSTLQVGYDLTITGGDTGSQTGILINTDNGSTDLKIVSSANTSDYATISTGANGATTIETVDNGGGESADLTLNIDGSLYIDADSGAARLNDGGGTYTPAHDDSLTTKSYVDTKSQNTIIIGGLMPRNVGSAGYHRAVPTSYDVSDLTVGNGTDPTTSLTVSTNGDHANNRLIAFPDNVVVTKCKVSISEGGSTNTTHNIHLMRYDIDADGDWSNGTVVATGTNSNSDDYSQVRFITLTLSGTASDLQVAESNQALVLCAESVDAINLYQSVKAYLKYEWA